MGSVLSRDDKCVFYGTTLTLYIIYLTSGNLPYYNIVSTVGSHIAALFFSATCGVLLTGYNRLRKIPQCRGFMEREEELLGYNNSGKLNRKHKIFTEADRIEAVRGVLPDNKTIKKAHQYFDNRRIDYIPEIKAELPGTLDIESQREAGYFKTGNSVKTMISLPNHVNLEFGSEVSKIYMKLGSNVETVKLKVSPDTEVTIIVNRLTKSLTESLADTKIEKLVTAAWDKDCAELTVRELRIDEAKDTYPPVNVNLLYKLMIDRVDESKNFEKLLKRYKDTLKRLSIRRNQAIIAKLPFEMTSLESLSVMDKIVNLPLKQLPALKRLGIIGTAMSTDNLEIPENIEELKIHRTFSKLSQPIISNNLRSIWLTDNRSISQAEIALVTNNCPNLRDIRIDSLRIKLTDKE